MATGFVATFADSRFGIQRINGVRSATSVMYHCLFAASQRAPSAFAASLSANGVTRLILIAGYRNRDQLSGSPTSNARSLQESDARVADPATAIGNSFVASGSRCTSLLAPDRHRYALAQPFNDRHLRLALLPPLVVPEVHSYFVPLFSL